MLKTSLGILAVGTAVVAAAPAHAVTPISLTVVGNTASGAFSKTITPAGPFSETFTFNLTAPGTTAAAAVTISVNNISLITFTSATLNGSPLTITTTGPLQTASISNLATVAGLQTLIINGTSGGDGSFGGSVSFAAVPEPATWALLILGFGAVGMMMRRRARRAASVRVSFA